MKLIYFLKQETRDQLLSIAKSAYAYFFVNKLLKYGTKEQRKTIFSQAFEGRVRNCFSGFPFVERLAACASWLTVRAPEKHYTVLILSSSNLN